jgi:CheY-like chemotaxis protein
VAKILVADDNSNIQKMVGLALKDHGIEVIAVGNGEAAVRKTSDIHPDLVLADVFMPVRNGYEVCKYVKDDPALKHIPVILLVGAFDPLDEQEAQRVGADGVLKKPFVPPDPLISMVKSALVRAGVAHAGFVPAKAVPEVPVEAPAAASESRGGSPNFAPKPTAALPEFETESFVDEAPARPAALKIEAGQQPVAFGSLLETPGTDTEEELSEVTAVPALERDWRTAEVEEEEEEEDADSKPSWRRDAGSEESKEEDVAASGNAWRDVAPEETLAHGRRHSHWTPTREKADLTEAAEGQENVHSGISERHFPEKPGRRQLRRECRTKRPSQKKSIRLPTLRNSKRWWDTPSHLLCNRKVLFPKRRFHSTLPLKTCPRSNRIPIIRNKWFLNNHLPRPTSSSQKKSQRLLRLCPLWHPQPFPSSKYLSSKPKKPARRLLGFQHRLQVPGMQKRKRRLGLRPLGMPRSRRRSVSRPLQNPSWKPV